MKNIYLLAVLGVLLLSACGEPARIVASRLIILGFDGMDPRLARQWMDDGSLPNFSQLEAQGEFHPLQTSNPPQSPVAWSDFATGSQAGEHGIYDFLRRYPGTYDPAFSISESIPPQSKLSLLGMEFPLEDGTIINRRNGRPFWLDIEENGGFSSVLRVPVTFPPDAIHRMLSGMGVPDLLGTQGTYTLYTTRPAPPASLASARVIQVRADKNGLIQTRLKGPSHPLKKHAPALSVELAMHPEGDGVVINLDGEMTRLIVGQWSDWIEIEFPFLGFASVSGMVRLHLISNYPEVQLYVSPIQINPNDPVVPLSSPPGYAAELAAEIGMYHTIGMPEETWSLNEGHLSDHAFLEMVRTIMAEREAMFYNTLDKHDSELVVTVFVQTDRVSHMFYRGLDKEHSLYYQTDSEARGAIHWIYQEADRILGETMARMGPDDHLIVLSDHGFAPFRWAVNLNRWLVEEGLLVLKGALTTSDVGFVNIDWSRTKAYAMGLNSVFINRSGREPMGIVSEAEAVQIKRTIIEKLPNVIDANNGLNIVAAVFDGDQLYPGNANGDAPDLVIGYTPGYRASWQTTLGGVPDSLITVNTKKWSGDHCILPTAVPGVLFTSFHPEKRLVKISDIAHYAKANWPNNQGHVRQKQQLSKALK